MYLHQPKEPGNLSDSIYEQNEDFQDEQMLLDASQQRPAQQGQTPAKNSHQNINSKPKPTQFQSNQQQTSQKLQNNDLYVNKQHLKIKHDLADYNDLQTQIQRLKKIKNEYKQQKHSIQKLTKVVQTLKSQNRSLKLEKQSNRQDSSPKNCLNEVPKNHQSYQREPGKRILNQNTLKGNIFSRNLINKNIELSQEGGYLSPQSHRRISSNSLRNLHLTHLNNEENYLNDMIRIDQEMMIKNHQNNKKSVIANFVEELKYQLQQNEIVLQRQKRAHRQTKQKLQACLEELVHMRSLIDRQKDTEFLERENIQLRKQVEIQIEQRLIIEEKLREKQLLLSQYECGISTRSSDFDRELDKMDQIYFSLERTLNL